MALRIRWTKRASEDVESIISFLELEWNESVILKFIRILNSKLESISYFPYLGVQITDDKELRALLITNHTRIYYRVDKNNLIVLRLFDTRKDPKKFNL